MIWRIRWQCSTLFRSIFLFLSFFFYLQWFTLLEPELIIQINDILNSKSENIITKLRNETSDEESTWPEEVYEWYQENQKLSRVSGQKRFHLIIKSLRNLFWKYFWKKYAKFWKFLTKMVKSKIEVHISGILKCLK